MTAFYHEWVARVKAHVPPERLLTFEPKQGWAPLCKFLGVPEPEGPYPRTNDTQQMLNMIQVKKKSNNVTTQRKTQDIIFLEIKEDGVHCPVRRPCYSGQYTWILLLILKRSSSLRLQKKT